jgi:hypothetical protein
VAKADCKRRPYLEQKEDQMAAVTCPYRTQGCGLSVPCARCRELASHRNGSRASYGRSSTPYWSRQTRG